MLHHGRIGRPALCRGAHHLLPGAVGKVTFKCARFHLVLDIGLHVKCAADAKRGDADERAQSGADGLYDGCWLNLELLRLESVCV